MIIVIETPQEDGSLRYSAIKSAVTIGSEHSVIYAFRDEEEFRKVFPKAPEFFGGILSWKENTERD